MSARPVEGVTSDGRSRDGDAAHTRLGDYVLLDRVGSGGSGAVHRAWQVSLQRLVAIKLMEGGAPAHPAGPSDEETGRFVREGRMAARLSHPHIVPIYEVGEHERRRYLVMKLITGQSMHRLCLEPRRAVALMRQVTDAIAYAHRNGVVHRDLKPHNLLLEGEDHVWITDFGIARSMKGGSTLTATGSVMGTPAYMPPEQARGQRCDERSDVYSLGATLYELLTGRPPFDETAELLVVMSRVLSGDPTPIRRLNPKVPIELATIVDKAMAKLPAHRYQTADELGDDLGRFLADQPIRARRPGLARRAAKWIKRRPVTSSAIGFGLALAAGGVLHARSLERQLAETTVAEASALGAAGNWEAARARYSDAARAFQRLGVSSLAPELGLLEAYHEAPPPLLVLTGHAAPVRAAAFLPDARHALSTGGDGTLRLWDVQLGREIRRFTRPDGSGPLTSLALSRAADVVLAGGEDGRVHLWRVLTGEPVRTLATRGGPVLKVALSPDGRRALSRTTGGIVQLWDVTSGTELRAFEVAAKRMVAVAFSPDGRHAITGRPIEDKGGVVNRRASYWDVESGRELQTLGGFASEIESVVFSPDGRRALTAGYDRTASVWDLESSRRLLALRGHRHGLTGAAFAPKDRIIVSAGQDNAVKLWDAADGKLVRSFDTGATVDALAVSPDGNFILTGGGDHTLKLWDLTVGQETRAFSGHESAVHAVALSPDGLLGLSGGTDRKVRVWDVATGREVRAFDHGAVVHGVALSPDGRTAIAVGSETLVKAWDVFSGAPRPAYQRHKGAVRAIAITPDGKRALSASERGEIALWETGSGRPVWTARAGDEVRSVAIDRDGARAIVASFDGTVRVLAVADGRELRLLRPDRPERMGAVDVSRDGNIIATGNDTKLVRLWDAHDGRELGALAGHLGDVRALRFSPDGRLLFSAGRDRTLRAWDPKGGRLLHVFSSASDALRSVSLSADGRLVLVGSEDGSLKLWDLEQIGSHRALEERLQGLRALAQRAPDDARVLAAMGTWYAFRGVSGWAVDLLARAEAKGADVSPLLLARAHWRAGDFPAARRQLQRALERREAPGEYLQLLTRVIGSSDQSARLAQLNSKDGRVRFPFLGVRVREQAVPGHDHHVTVGPVVTRVFPRSPAHLAGLRTGDVLLRADDQLIDSDARLTSYLASRAAGVSVKLSFLRAGAQHTVSATLSERPSQLWDTDATEVRESRSGFALQTLTPALAASLGLDPDTQGALVAGLGVLPPGLGASALQLGDVVVKVAARPVATAAQAVAAMTALPFEKWNRIEVLRPAPAR